MRTATLIKTGGNVGACTNCITHMSAEIYELEVPTLTIRNHVHKEYGGASPSMAVQLHNG